MNNSYFVFNRKCSITKNILKRFELLHASASLALINAIYYFFGLFFHFIFFLLAFIFFLRAWSDLKRSCAIKKHPSCKLKNEEKLHWLCVLHLYQCSLFVSVFLLVYSYQCFLLVSAFFTCIVSLAASKQIARCNL